MVKTLLPKKDEDIKKSESEPEEIEEIKTKPKKSKKEIIISESSKDSEELEKTPKRKVNYVQTDARKQVFEKARKVREEKVAKRKAE
jgi:hypothetical protein